MGVLFSVSYTALMVANEGKAQVLSPSATSSSTSASGANSASGSNSGANVLVDQRSTGSGNVYNPAQPTDVTVRSAPQVYAPSVITGNVCALGASAGASFIGTGVTLGGTWESEQCENRQRAALLHNMGYKQAAKELSCDNRSTYEAMKRAGDPCLVRPAWEPQGVPVQQPVRITAPMPVMTPVPLPSPMQGPRNYPRCNARLGIVDNCAS
jgi:hypothetical protein